MMRWMVKAGAFVTLAVLGCAPALAAKAPREATDLAARVELHTEHHVVAEDGSEVSTFRSVTRVLKSEAAENVRQRTIRHSASA